MKPSENTLLADISPDQYEVIKDIYSDKILEQKPIIKIPDKNKHLYVQLNTKLEPNTIVYPESSPSDTCDEKVYLLAKPKSAIHRIFSL
jgi:hypothetical protein